MKKNTGLKVLCVSVVCVVALILMNHGENKPAAVTPDPDNINAAIASQFNDNIRDVAARLQETEKKLAQFEHRKPENNAELTNAIQALQDELNLLKESRLQPPVEPEVNTPHEDIPNIAPVNPVPVEVSKPIELPDEQQPEPETMPYYTIPAGSDLGRTTLLSALIGEVPSDGKLMQPLFPFSALISRGDLMAANGIPLPPDIAGMKIIGYSKLVW